MATKPAAGTGAALDALQRMRNGHTPAHLDRRPGLEQLAEQILARQPSLGRRGALAQAKQEWTDRYHTDRRAAAMRGEGA